MPPRRDPAVLPTGTKGTAGKTANTQKIAKAIEPRTTFTEEAKAIFAAQQEKIFLLYYSTGSMLMKFPSQCHIIAKFQIWTRSQQPEG